MNINNTRIQDGKKYTLLADFGSEGMTVQAQSDNLDILIQESLDIYAPVAIVQVVEFHAVSDKGSQ